MHTHDGNQVWWSAPKMRGHLVRLHGRRVEDVQRRRERHLYLEHEAEHDQEGGQ